jgi:hypothetical protein
LLTWQLTSVHCAFFHITITITMDGGSLALDLDAWLLNKENTKTVFPVH